MDKLSSTEKQLGKMKKKVESFTKFNLMTDTYNL